MNDILQKVRKLLRQRIKCCIVFLNHYAARKKSTLGGNSLLWFYWLVVVGKVGLGFHITSESWLLEGERSSKEREDDILALDKIPHSKQPKGFICAVNGKNFSTFYHL